MKMEVLANVIDGIALAIEIVATIIMFLNSPPGTPGDAGCKVLRKKERRTRLGFLILCVGFIFQLISFIIKL